MVNRFWDSKAREVYSKAELNEEEIKIKKEGGEI